MRLKILLGVIVLSALVIGAYFAVKEQGMRVLKRTISERLGAGDYLAALAAAGELRKTGRVTSELEEQIASAARFLVAEDAFQKARSAFQEKRFADASALLRGSEAVTNPAFKYYEEAKKTYEEAEALAAGVAHKTSVTISSLESRAAAEKAKREEVEADRQRISRDLLKTKQAVDEKKAEIAAAAEKLEQSRKETEARQAALAAEQARTRALMEQVEKESRQKFFTELRTYRDMTQKGREQIENAITEIDAKRDVTALIYMSQARILFEEARDKIADLRASRTPTNYQNRVGDMASSLEQFLEASKQLRNAVVYIEDQNGSDFTGSAAKARSALADGVSLLSKVSDFLAGNSF